jgi:hypothetical protein
MADEHERINCPYAEDLGEFRADIRTIKTMLSETKGLVENQNGRVRKLENWRNMLVGAWGLALIVLGLWIKFSE